MVRLPLFDVELADNIGRSDNLSYSLQMRPSGDFAFASGRNKLADIVKHLGDPALTFVVPGDAPDEDSRHDQNHLLRLSCYVNLENKLSVGCAGAVLNCVQRSRAAVLLPGDQETSLASSIETFTLRDTMYVGLSLYYTTDMLGSSIPIPCCLYKSSHQKAIRIRIRGQNRVQRKVFLFMVCFITSQRRRKDGCCFDSTLCGRVRV